MLLVTVDRSPNIDLKALGIQRDVSGTPIEPSPGILYPDGSPPDANTHVTAVLSNTQTVPFNYRFNSTVFRYPSSLNRYKCRCNW